MRQMQLEFDVIGSMMVLNEYFYYGVAYLDENCFLNTDAQKVFRVLKKLYEEGKDVESELLTKYFDESFEGTLSYLVEFCLDSKERFKACVRELSERKKERQFAEIANKIAKGEIDKEKALEKLAEISIKQEEKIKTARDACKGFLELYEQKDSFPSVPSYVDKLELHVRFEYITTIAARPSIGKTVFALGIIKKQAEQGHPVLFFSQELPVDEEIMPRLIAMELGVTLDDVKEKRVPAKKVVEVVEKIENLPIEFIDGKVTIPRFKAIVYAHKEWLTQGDKRGVIWVDYFQLFRRHTKFENEKAFLDYVVDTCVDITKTLKIPVILLAQINREARTGKKTRPTMDQIKGTGNLEQASTNILVLHRDFDNSPNVLDAYIDKTRNKGRGLVSFPFVKGFPVFDENEDQKKVEQVVEGVENTEQDDDYNFEGFDF